MSSSFRLSCISFSSELWVRFEEEVEEENKRWQSVAPAVQETEEEAEDQRWTSPPQPWLWWLCSFLPCNDLRTALVSRWFINLPGYEMILDVTWFYVMEKWEVNISTLNVVFFSDLELAAQPQDSAESLTDDRTEYKLIHSPESAVASQNEGESRRNSRLTPKGKKPLTCQMTY